MYIMVFIISDMYHGISGVFWAFTIVLLFRTWCYHCVLKMYIGITMKFICVPWYYGAYLNVYYVYHGIMDIYHGITIHM